MLLETAYAGPFMSLAIAQHAVNDLAEFRSCKSEGPSSILMYCSFPSCQVSFDSDSKVQQCVVTNDTIAIGLVINFLLFGERKC